MPRKIIFKTEYQCCEAELLKHHKAIREMKKRKRLKNQKDYMIQ